MEPIYKFNDGMGAILCNHCRTIIHTGKPSKRVLCNPCLEKLVYGFRTKHKEGFTDRELKRLLSTIGKDNINMEKYNSALTGITCMVIDEEMVIYHCDVLTALRCGMENRDIKSYEWD